MSDKRDLHRDTDAQPAEETTSPGRRRFLRLSATGAAALVAGGFKASSTDAGGARQG